MFMFLPALSPDRFPRASLGSLLGDYLRDPAGTVASVWATVYSGVLEWAPILAPSVVLLVLAASVGRRWWRRRCHDQRALHARVVTVLAPPTVNPDGAGALFANLVGVLRPAWRRFVFGQPHLAWEYVFTHTGLTIRIWLPGTVPPGLVDRAIEAAWPGARTQTAPASPPMTLSGPEGEHAQSVGGELRLARSEALPLRTEFPTDPLRALIGAPAGLGPHESVAVQILARPVTGARVRAARRRARRTRAGLSPHLAGRVLDLLTPRLSSTGGSPKPGTAPPVDRQSSLESSAEDRAIVGKQRGAQYETRVRYAVATTVAPGADKQQRVATQQHLSGHAHALASAFAPFGEHNYYRRTRLRHPVAVLTRRHLDRGDLLSVPELAAIAHLPTDEAVPGLDRAGAQAVPPPPGIATPGEGVKPIGNSDAGQPRPVGLRVADARHHTHILGATGSGKSELMARMILSDAEHGRGLVAIDPKGDLAEDILMRLPSRLGHKVTLLDADSTTRPPVLNPLDGPDTARIVDNLVSVFSRIYAANWGPRTDDVLRCGLLTLRAMPGTPTLTDLPKLLTVPAFRQRALETVTDAVLIGFWQWYESLSEPTRAQVVAPLMNKLRGLLLRPFVRNTLAGGESTVDFDQILGDGGICLVRLNKDALALDTARVLGSLAVAGTWQAATGRARLPQHQRPDCSLYIDECHNFLHMPYPIEDMLAESRAYRMSITLAHQYLRQLPKNLAEGIATNARSKVVFTASPDDAGELARHTQPRVNEHDLAHLAGFHIAARLVRHGEEAPAFTATTEKLPPAIPGRAAEIRQRARNHNPTDPKPASDDTDGDDDPGHTPPPDPRRTT